MTKNLHPYYEALMDDLSMDVDNRYLEHLKEKDRTLVIDNLIFDLDHLDSAYRCQDCRRRHPAAYCCAGYDVELTRRDLTAIDAILPELLGRYPAVADRIGSAGYWDRGESFERLLRRVGDADDCVFLLESGQGCSIHAYAEAAGRDPLELKPYICSLYPVVVIVIGEEVVVSTLNDESKIILETGDNATPCALPPGRDETHILIQGEEILTRMFGPEIIGRVKAALFPARAPGPLDQKAGRAG